MTQNYGGYAPPHTSGTGPSGTSSTTDVARDEAIGVGESVKEAGTHVTQTATDQAKEVAAEAGQQARDLMYEGRQQVRQQAMHGQQRAADGLSTIADELRQMAQSSGQSGIAAELARQGADRVHEVATWLQQREPGDLLNEVRRWARQHPGTFLLGAALAGVVAGRLTSGIVAYERDTAETGPIPAQTPVPPIDADMPTTPAMPYPTPAGGPPPAYPQGYAGDMGTMAPSEPYAHAGYPRQHNGPGTTYDRDEDYGPGGQVPR